MNIFIDEYMKNIILKILNSLSNHTFRKRYSEYFFCYDIILMVIDQLFNISPVHHSLICPVLVESGEHPVPHLLQSLYLT